MRALLSPIVVVALLSACKKSETAPTTSAPSASASVVANAPEPPPEPQLTVPLDAKGLTATLENKSYVFKSAWIVSAMEYDWLFLSTGDATCSTETAGVTRLEIDLHAGPSDRHFAGHPIAVSVNIDPFLEKKKIAESWIGTPFATVLLDAGAAWKKGGHVRGTLDFDYRVQHGADVARYSGNGAFDAVICDERTEWWWHGGSTHVEPSPVAGRYGDESFVAMSAIAILMHDERNDVTYIDTIRLYPVEDVACEGREAQEKRASYVQLSGPVPGANDRQRFVGTTQPTSVFWFTPPTSPDAAPLSHAVRGDAWVRFDAIDLALGATLPGSMFVETAKSKEGEPPARFAGTFAARVCKW